MKTRPVFESFSDFVNFIGTESSLILEGEITVEEFMNKLSSFFDEDAQNAFLGVKNTLEGSPAFTNSEVAEEKLSSFKKNLDTFAKQIENAQRDEDQGGLILDYVGTTQSDIVLTQMVSGKVKYIRGIGGSSQPEEGSGTLALNNWNPIEDILSYANSKNLYFTKRGFPSLGKNGKWIKDDYITNSGSVNQLVISSIDAGINFVDITYGETFNILNDVVSPESKVNLGEFYDKENFKDSSVTRQVVLYTVKDLEPGVGDKIPSSYIKKEFSTVVIPGEVVELVRILEGTDKMFAQGVSTLAKDKEEMTKKAIDQLLGEFSSIESISIVGGASYEGGLEVNKKLVAGRATTVKTLIESMHPDLKGKVTADTTDFSKIQPKDEPAEYTKWRKIYLNIKGNVIGDSKNVKKEITSVFGTDIRFDKVTITQWVLNFEFTKPQKK